MALVIILIADTPEGPRVQCNAEPAMPQTVLDGRPTPAQAAAAMMLNALSKAVGPASANDAPRVIVPH